MILEKFYENVSVSGMLFFFAYPKSWKIIFLTYLKIVSDTQVASI